MIYQIRIVEQKDSAVLADNKEKCNVIRAYPDN